MRVDVDLAGSPPRSARRPWLRLLSAVMDLAGGKAELVRHGERGWATATFAGTRHTIVLTFDGAAAVDVGEAFIDALPEHEFAIPGQLVADAAVVACDHHAQPPRLQVECEILLLEDA